MTNKTVEQHCLDVKQIIFCIDEVEQDLEKLKKCKKQSRWLSKKYFVYKRRIRELSITVSTLNQLISRLTLKVVNIVLPQYIGRDLIFKELQTMTPNVTYFKYKRGFSDEKNKTY